MFYKNHKRMKSLTFFCLTFFITLTLNAGTLLPVSVMSGEDDKEHEIELKTDTPSPKVRRLLPNPIKASINSTSLNIVFSYNIGYVTINIYSDYGGIVYSNHVDTNSQKTLSFSTLDLDSGTYNICFIKPDGSCISGSFEIY